MNKSILLYGDFSGVHLNLYKGLIDIGHEVDFISTGDGFKGISGNIELENRSKGVGNFQKLGADFSNILKINRLKKKYDIVQIMSPFPGVMSTKYAFDYFGIKEIKKKSEKLFLYIAGCDSNGVWYGAGFSGGTGGTTFSGNVTMTSTSSHTGLASFAGGISAAGGITFTNNVQANGYILSSNARSWFL